MISVLDVFVRQGLDLSVVIVRQGLELSCSVVFVRPEVLGWCLLSRCRMIIILFFSFVMVRLIQVESDILSCCQDPPLPRLLPAL